MSWVIGDVTLPYAPTEISDDSDCDTDSLALDSEESVVFSKAPGIRIVIWSGSISDLACPTKADLESAYLSDLRGYQGSVQSVSNPSGAYTADWYIKKVSFNEAAEGSLARVTYSIVMWLGSDVEII